MLIFDIADEILKFDVKDIKEQMQLNDDELKFKAWDEYVADKPILKSMMAEMAQGILHLKKNYDALHERQTDIWNTQSAILETLNKHGLMGDNVGEM